VRNGVFFMEMTDVATAATGLSACPVFPACGGGGPPVGRGPPLDDGLAAAAAVAAGSLQPPPPPAAACSADTAGSPAPAEDGARAYAWHAL
jgi:hypothetical protein